MALNRNELANGIYFAGLLILVAGLPLSMFLMSVSQLVLLASWIISGNLYEKLKTFLTNPVTLLTGSVFFLHLIGIAWSNDLAYAWHDCRIKAPLLILPLIISTSDPLPQKKINQILTFFTGAVVLATLISMAVLLGFTSRQVNDIRDISIFISHIRFGLLICITIFYLSWLLYSRTGNQKKQDTLVLILLVWLLIFLVIMEAVTALMILMVVAFFAGIVFLTKRHNRFARLFILVPVLILVSLFIYIRQISNEIFITVIPDFSKMDSLTIRGNPYILNTPYNDTENGHAVWTYICPKEIDSLWPVRSKLSIQGKDNKGQIMYFTMLRYMTSKGLRKDADGIRQLNNKDIKAIEDGYTNYRYTKTSSLSYRIYQIVWEFNQYRHVKKPEGHSVFQRLEFWKAGWHIFKRHLLFGVGTGDVQLAFDEEYEKSNSTLPPEWRLRAHNQYLTFALTFGITGFLLFLFSIVYPFIVLNKKTDILYVLFLITAILSFFTEDTLETQAGATFYAFFNAFLLFRTGLKTTEIDGKPD